MADSPENQLNVTQDSLEEQDKKKLDEIVKQINELKDKDNDNDKIENMNGVLTAEFSSNLTPETAKKLLNAIPNYGDEQTKPEGLPDLINFLKPIANKFSSSIEGEFDQKDGTFKSKIDQSEGDNESKLNKFKKKRRDEENKLFQEGENIRDERLKNVKNTTDRIKEIIKKPNENNTKALQKFIYENLNETSKTKFAKENCIGKVYNNNNFDGKFGISTLTYLDEEILPKIKKYVTDVKESIAVEEKNQPSKGVEDEHFENVKVKESINLPEGNAQINAANLLAGLPNEAKAEFKGTGISIEEQKDQEVTVIVESGGETKEFTIIAKVDTANKKVDLKIKGTGDPTTSEVQTTPLDTTPYVDEGKKYQVMKNTQTIAGSANLRGVTFYTANAFDKTEPENGEPWQTVEAPTDRDYECLMKMGDSVYKVKVDQNGNLCPIATEINKKLKLKDGSDATSQVLLSKNKSCENYLYNKLPDKVKNDCQIRWSDSFHDYTLTSYGRTLSIEPMTIAGDWISKDLGRNLAFLNLTNYLRTMGAERGKKDPDINKKMKVKGIKLDGKKVYIDKEAFGLEKSTDDELSRFKKYNNHEDWNDDWDKKRANKEYRKIQLQ